MVSQEKPFVEKAASKSKYISGPLRTLKLKRKKVRVDDGITMAASSLPRCNTNVTASRWHLPVKRRSFVTMETSAHCCGSIIDQCTQRRRLKMWWPSCLWQQNIKLLYFFFTLLSSYYVWEENSRIDNRATMKWSAYQAYQQVRLGVVTTAIYKCQSTRCL